MKLKNLAKLRRARGLTQADVAGLIGVSVSAVGHWETGTCFPLDEHLQALCAAFRVDAGYLMGVRGAKAQRADNVVPLQRVA